jgi:hypothetical protein
MRALVYPNGVLNQGTREELLKKYPTLVTTWTQKEVENVLEAKAIDYLGYIKSWYVSKLDRHERVVIVIPPYSDLSSDAVTRIFPSALKFGKVTRFTETNNGDWIEARRLMDAMITQTSGAIIMPYPTFLGAPPALTWVNATREATPVKHISPEAKLIRESWIANTTPGANRKQRRKQRPSDGPNLNGDVLLCASAAEAKATGIRDVLTVSWVGVMGESTRLNTLGAYFHRLSLLGAVPPNAYDTNDVISAYILTGNKPSLPLNAIMVCTKQSVRGKKSQYHTAKNLEEAIKLAATSRVFFHPSMSELTTLLNDARVTTRLVPVYVLIRTPSENKQYGMLPIMMRSKSILPFTGFPDLISDDASPPANLEFIEGREWLVVYGSDDALEAHEITLHLPYFSFLEKEDEDIVARGRAVKLMSGGLIPLEYQVTALVSVTSKPYPKSQAYRAYYNFLDSFQGHPAHLCLLSPKGGGKSTAVVLLNGEGIPTLDVDEYGGVDSPEFQSLMEDPFSPTTYRRVFQSWCVKLSETMMNNWDNTHRVVMAHVPAEVTHTGIPKSVVKVVSSHDCFEVINMREAAGDGYPNEAAVSRFIYNDWLLASGLLSITWVDVLSTITNWWKDNSLFVE